jgi:hypothetical protein
VCLHFIFCDIGRCFENFILVNVKNRVFFDSLSCGLEDGNINVSEEPVASVFCPEDGGK